jgi:spore germination protein YaaH
VYPFGYTLGKDGTVYDTAKLRDEPWASFITTARAKKVRVIPTVMSGDGPTLHAILSNSASRIKLEDDIAALVQQNNWDGIDIDFEAKLVETKPYFSLFLKGLYQRVGKKWLYCTIESRTPVSSRYPDTSRQKMRPTTPTIMLRSTNTATAYRSWRTTKAPLTGA